MPNLSVRIPATGDRKNVVPMVSEPTKAEIIYNSDNFARRRKRIAREDGRSRTDDAVVLSRMPKSVPITDKRQSMTD